MSASSQSLGFILSLRMNSSFITSSYAYTFLFIFSPVTFWKTQRHCYSLFFLIRFVTTVQACEPSFHNSLFVDPVKVGRLISIAILWPSLNNYNCHNIYWDPLFWLVKNGHLIALTCISFFNEPGPYSWGAGPFTTELLLWYCAMLLWRDMDSLQLLTFYLTLTHIFRWKSKD